MSWRDQVDETDGIKIEVTMRGQRIVTLEMEPMVSGAPDSGNPFSGNPFALSCTGVSDADVVKLGLFFLRKIVTVTREWMPTPEAWDDDNHASTWVEDPGGNPSDN